LRVPPYQDAPLSLFERRSRINNPDEANKPRVVLLRRTEAA
jgi:hypothetical protein